MGQKGSTANDRIEKDEKLLILLNNEQFDPEKAEIERNYKAIFEIYVRSLPSLSKTDQVQLLNRLYSALTDIVNESYKKGREQGLNDGLNALEQLQNQKEEKSKRRDK